MEASFRQAVWKRRERPLLGVLNVSRGNYWFAHKPPVSWTLLQRAWGRCDAPIRWAATPEVARWERTLLNRTGRPVLWSEQPPIPRGLLYYPH